MTTTTLIKNGYLLDRHLPFEQGDVLIENETIAQVAHDIDFQADIIINAQDKVVMPGLISAHTHSFMAQLRGLTDNLSLSSWLLYIGYVMKDMSIREQYVWSAIAAIELLKKGTTSPISLPPILPPTLSYRQNTTHYLYISGTTTKIPLFAMA